MTATGDRLNKALARAGVAARRKADQLIFAGAVRVNGNTVTEPGTRVDPATDVVEVHGKPVRLPQEEAAEVWALYKPKNCVSTLSDPQGRPTVKDHFPKTAVRLVPVGRLDYDAEGLLLLTNDGELANRIAHPSFAVPRIYLVKVKGLVSQESLRSLGKGPVLAGERRRPVQARVLHTVNDKTWLEVTLREGVTHHIKRMFKTLGHRVLKIKRYQIGPVELGDMEPGQCRRISLDDLRAALEAPAGPRRKPPPRQRRTA